MQGQMLSMQSTLDRILNVIQGAHNTPTSNPSGTIIPHSAHPTAPAESHPHPQVDSQLHQIMSPAVLIPSCSPQPNASIDGQHFFAPAPSDMRGPSGRHSSAINAPTPKQNFPPLPGFAPPVSANPYAARCYCSALNIRVLPHSAPQIRNIRDRCQ